MAKKVEAYIKLQVAAGMANPDLVRKGRQPGPQARAKELHRTIGIG